MAGRKRAGLAPSVPTLVGLVVALACARVVQSQRAVAYCARTMQCGHNEKEKEFIAVLAKFGLDDPKTVSLLEERGASNLQHFSRLEPNRMQGTGLKGQALGDLGRALQHVGAKGHQAATWKRGDKRPEGEVPKCEHCGADEHHHVGPNKYCSEIAADNAILWDLMAQPKEERNQTLIEACKEGNRKRVALSLEAGAKPDCYDKKGDRKRLRPLHYAVQGKYLGVLEILLENGADPNIRDLDGLMPLHMAVGVGENRVTRLLLQAGARPDEFGGLDMAYPIHFAVTNTNLAILKMLLETPYEALPDVKDNHGKTALLIAVQTGKLLFAEELLKAGADPLIEDHDGNTVAMAVQKLQDPFMDALLKKYSRASHDGIDEDTRLKIDL